MPLIKREVEPVLVSQVDIRKDVSNELECVTNYTLSSIIRQLGNLGKHAEDIFGELLQEATGLSQRCKNLKNHIATLRNTVNSLNTETDSVSMRDINSRTTFTSSLALEMEVVSSPTMPSAMKETYNRCEKPPPLSNLNRYRDDKKDALKFYTDPKFFFERWCTDQRKVIIKKKKRRERRPLSNMDKGPTKVTRRNVGQGKGKELDDIDRERQTHKKSTRAKSSNTQSGHENKAPRAPVEDREPVGQAEMPPPPPTPPVSPMDLPTDTGGDLPLPPPPGSDMYESIDDRFPGSANILPPPPPMPTNLFQPQRPQESFPLPPPPPATTPPSGAGPPPPPPPPVPNMPPPPPAPCVSATTPVRSPTSQMPQAGLPDTRDDLLSAIKKGMELRKVVVNANKQGPNGPAPDSVEAILRRRIAMEASSDEETGSQFSSDDSEWDEEEN